MKEGWEYKKLEDICSKGSSNISLNKIEDNNGEFSLYGASGLVKGIDFYHQSQQYIGIVKDGSGVGRVNIYPPKTSLVGTMQYIFPKKGCEIGYLKYLLQGLHLDNFKTGAAIPHIYFKDYGKCVVPIPTITEQQQIVEELDLLSSVIEKKKCQLNELDNLSQSLFYEMFGDPITNDKGWEMKKLGDTCVFLQGEQVPVEEQSDIQHEGMVRFLRIIDFTQGNEPPRFVFCKDKKHILDNEEIAIVRYGSPGFICYGKYGVIANNLFKIIPKNKEQYVFRYLVSWLSSDAFQSVVNGNQYGAALQAIKFGTIKDIPFIQPPLTLQQQFASKIEAIEHQKELIKQSIKEVETLFNSRMDYYFN